MSKIVEYKIEIGNGSTGRDNSSTLFSDIYAKGEIILKDIIQTQNRYYGDKSSTTLENTGLVNNIIAFCGDRGTGKTSAMNEFAEIVAKNDSTLAVLPVIDPTMFSTNDSILEIIIARMFEKINVTKIEDVETQRKVLKKFEQIYGQLATLYEKKEDRFSKDFRDNNLETINRLKGSLEIRTTLEEIVELYLDESKTNTKKEHLIIKIDDVDMNLSYAYTMIEEIRKYLSIKNVIVLVALNDVQISKLISNEFKKDLKIRDKASVLASNYLTKLFPPQNRLYLPRLDKLILSNEARFVGYNKQGEVVDNGMSNESMVDTILGTIFNKTRLIFLKNKYGFNTLIPTNLRELSQLRLFLENLENIHDDETKDTFNDIYNKDLNVKIKRNLVLFRDYFLYDRINVDLSNEELELLRMLPNLQAGKVNKEIYNYAMNKAKAIGLKIDIAIDEESEEKTGPAVLNVAKVLTTLNKLRANDKVDMDQFIYYLKCTYSMIILESTLNAINDGNTSNLLGNMGKNIIGTYNDPKRFEYEFYPIVDKDNQYIKVRNLSVKQMKLINGINHEPMGMDFLDRSKKESWITALENAFVKSSYSALANYLFLSFVTYGMFDGTEFYKSAKTYSGTAGVQKGHFGINNFIYHLLDIEKSISRNFDDILSVVEDDVKEEKVNYDFEKVKEMIREAEYIIKTSFETELLDKLNEGDTNESKNSNTLLLFPIYSIDYIEKINNFKFEYKSGTGDEKFYRLIFDNFFNKLTRCNEKILTDNKFLENTSINDLAEQLTMNLNGKLKAEDGNFKANKSVAYKKEAIKEPFLFLIKEFFEANNENEKIKNEILIQLKKITMPNSNSMKLFLEPKGTDKHTSAVIKISSLILELEELKTNLMNFSNNNIDTHDELYDLINDLDQDITYYTALTMSNLYESKWDEEQLVYALNTRKFTNKRLLNDAVKKAIGTSND